MAPISDSTWRENDGKGNHERTVQLCPVDGKKPSWHLSWNRWVSTSATKRFSAPQPVKSEVCNDVAITGTSGGYSFFFFWRYIHKDKLVWYVSPQGTISWADLPLLLDGPWTGPSTWDVNAGWFSQSILTAHRLHHLNSGSKCKTPKKQMDDLVRVQNVRRGSQFTAHGKFNQWWDPGPKYINCLRRRLISWSMWNVWWFQKCKNTWYWSGKNLRFALQFRLYIHICFFLRSP